MVAVAVTRPGSDDSPPEPVVAVDGRAVHGRCGLRGVDVHCVDRLARSRAGACFQITER